MFIACDAIFKSGSASVIVLIIGTAPVHCVIKKSNNFAAACADSCCARLQVHVWLPGPQQYGAQQVDARASLRPGAEHVFPLRAVAVSTQESPAGVGSERHCLRAGRTRVHGELPAFTVKG